VVLAEGAFESADAGYRGELCGWWSQLWPVAAVVLVFCGGAACCGEDGGGGVEGDGEVFQGGGCCGAGLDGVVVGGEDLVGAFLVGRPVAVAGGE